MKRKNKSNLSFLTWANLMVLTASVVVPTFPANALAADRGTHPPGSGGPGPNPAPAPAPAPSTPAAPAPDTGAASAAGRADASPDGEREGRERAPADGQRAGDQEGYRSGFDHCQAQARDRAHDEGFQRGFGEGSVLGSQDGRSNGDRDGSNRGVSEGQADGFRRADQDSNAAAAPQGRDKGIAEANSSDATDRGRRDGTARGDADALAQAQASDYPRGRKDYNAAQYAQTPQSHGDMTQKPAVAGANQSLAELFSFAASSMLPDMAPAIPGGSASPDFRYMTLKRNYPTPQENQAYASGAREGYSSGFQSGYQSAYDGAYHSAYDQGSRRGCEDANRRDYRPDFDRGEREGRDRGYHEAYDRSYRDASNFAYNREFGPASNQTYQNNYDTLFSKHFEEARSAAYAARVDQLYGAAFDDARSAKYAEMYPQYAVSEYQRGQKDEAKDFAQRPVRITGVEATETIPNGVFEPGEPLRLHLQVRNFAKSAMRAQDLSIQIKARNTDQSIVTIKQEYLVQGLKAQSVSDIHEALEFQANELAAGRSIKFDVALVYQGKVIDTTTLEVRPNFMVQVELAETPSFKEGIAMPIRVKLTNTGSKSASGVVLNLKTSADQLEVAQPTITVGSLAAGESRIVEYSAIGRSISQAESIQLGLAATEGGSLTGRRIGALDLSRQFPVINDYLIDLANNAVNALRAPGVTRIAYTISNKSRRLMFNSLQVKVRFLNTEDASNFVVIGPNPQLLMPMDQGESVSFTVPVLVKAANKGGVIEVEVQEAGRTVVIHREDFSQAQTLQ